MVVGRRECFAFLSGWSIRGFLFADLPNGYRYQGQVHHFAKFAKEKIPCAYYLPFSSSIRRTPMPLSQLLTFSMLTDAILLKKPDAIERFRNETLRVFGVLEIQLSGKYTGEPRDYLAGNGKGKYSVADIGTWPWVKGWQFSGFTQEEMDQFPHLLKWIDRIAQRPAVKRGIGEKYNMKK